MVERVAVNYNVVGSNPTFGENRSNEMFCKILYDYVIKKLFNKMNVCIAQW